MKTIGKFLVFGALSITVLPIGVSVLGLFLKSLLSCNATGLEVYGCVLPVAPVITFMLGLHWVAVGGLLIGAPMAIIGSIMLLISTARSNDVRVGREGIKKKIKIFLLLLILALPAMYLIKILMFVQPWNAPEDGVHWMLTHEVTNVSPDGSEVQFAYQAARKCKTGATPTGTFTLDFKDGSVAQVGCKGVINHLYKDQGSYSVVYKEKDLPKIYTSFKLGPNGEEKKKKPPAQEGLSPI